MAISQQKTVRNIYELSEVDKTPGPATPVGALFSNVFDTGVVGQTKVSLKQFYNHYCAFMNNNMFAYEGYEEPKNPHIWFWIDSSVSSGFYPEGGWVDGTLDTFPEFGDPTKLYNAPEGIYKWDSETQQYVLVSTRTVWEDFEEDSGQ